MRNVIIGIALALGGLLVGLTFWHVQTDHALLHQLVLIESQRQRAAVPPPVEKKP